MRFTREQKRSAYQSLPSDTQDFVHSNSLSALIKLVLLGAGLSEEDAEGDGDSLIMEAMYGLLTLHDAISEIAQLAHKKVEELEDLEFALEEQVFSRMVR